jgi:hypothetical protein
VEGRLGVRACKEYEISRREGKARSKLVHYITGSSTFAGTAQAMKDQFDLRNKKKITE